MKPDYVFQDDEEYWVPIVVYIKKIVKNDGIRYSRILYKSL